MSNKNTNQTININEVILMVLGLVLPFFLSAFLLLTLSIWMPNEIVYPGILSLIILSIEFYIVASIFTKILSLCGLPEKKLDEMGFLGSIISAVTSILAIFLGYYLMRSFGLTSVEVSPKGILLVAIASTIILSIVVKALERTEAPTNKSDE